MDFFDYFMGALAVIMFALGIAEIVGFIITGMTYCLIFSALPFGMFGLWFNEEIIKKNRLSWLKKNSHR